MYKKLLSLSALATAGMMIAPGASGSAQAMDMHSDSPLTCSIAASNANHPSQMIADGEHVSLHTNVRMHVQTNMDNNVSYDWVVATDAMGAVDQPVYGATWSYTTWNGDPVQFIVTASHHETGQTAMCDHTVNMNMLNEEAQSNTIVDAAVATDALSTLVAAVTAADLVETLSSEGPFTVFAPTNDAFAAVDQDTLASLLMPENKQALTDILTYHVVAGEVAASDLYDGQVITTVLGQELMVSVDENGVRINDSTVAIADVMTDNGIVHVIDAVLLPASN